MNKQQYEMACEIIKVDCHGTGQLKNHGVTCAVGGLFAAIDPDWAESPENHNNDGYHVVADVFDIPESSQGIDKIVRANDRTRGSIKDRRKAVLEVLREIYENSEVPNG